MLLCDLLYQFLPVYHPSDEEMKHTKLFARNVQVLMAKYTHYNDA